MLQNFVAIAALVRGYEEKEQYQTLIARNESISKHCNFEFDTLLFHEGNVPIDHQDYIQSFTPSLKIKFINVKSTYPRTAFNDHKNKINNTLCPPTSRSNQFSLGYKHMCHFWFIDFLAYTHNYQYLIRVDEDCILVKFDNNIVDFMVETNTVFISPYFREFDVPDVTLGMTDVLRDFLIENNFQPKNKLKENQTSVRCPYTNCMILNCDYFRKKTIFRQFQKKVDESSCIYSNRWGDLPLWGLALWYLEDADKYAEITDIAYFHGSHGKMISKASLEKSLSKT